MLQKNEISLKFSHYKNYLKLIDKNKFDQVVILLQDATIYVGILCDEKFDVEAFQTMLDLEPTKWFPDSLITCLTLKAELKRAIEVNSTKSLSAVVANLLDKMKTQKPDFNLYHKLSCIVVLFGNYKNNFSSMSDEAQADFAAWSNNFLNLQESLISSSQPHPGPSLRRSFYYIFMRQRAESMRQNSTYKKNNYTTSSQWGEKELNSSNESTLEHPDNDLVPEEDCQGLKLS